MNILSKSLPSLLSKLHSGASHVELVYKSHSRWPLTASFSGNNACRPLRISILDSSFNPPTLAHLALANAPRPRQGASNMHEDFDARLLLLSVKNADKTLKPGDATYQQRVEMMYHFSQSIVGSSHRAGPDGAAPNVAIAIIDEPTFVGKSRLLHTLLQNQLEELVPDDGTADRPMIEMTFLLGMDTLERVFATRYYPSTEAMMDSLRRFFDPAPHGDNSRILCANRSLPSASSSTTSQQTPNDPDMLPPSAKEFMDSGRISIVDIGSDLSTYSSTAVRRSVAQDDDSWKRLVVPSVAEYISEHRLYHPLPEPAV